MTRYTGFLNQFQGLTEEHLLLGSEIRIFDETKPITQRR